MKVSFIIPLHNEEKNAQAAIERIVHVGEKHKWDFEVIPIDDRSVDTTKKILQTMAKKHPVVRPMFRIIDQNQEGNTMGIALREATAKARGDVVIWTMGDLADDVETFKAIIAKIQKGFDMVLASRYMPGGSRGNLDPIKAFLSSWGTVLARALFGIPVHDITNAFRGFRKEVFDAIRLQSVGFSISPEFAIKAYLAGFTLGEVPTTYTNRVEGVSNFKLYRMTKSYLGIYFSLFFRYKLFHQSYDFFTQANSS